MLDTGSALLRNTGVKIAFDRSRREIQINELFCAWTSDEGDDGGTEETTAWSNTQTAGASKVGSREKKGSLSRRTFRVASSFGSETRFLDANIHLQRSSSLANGCSRQFMSSTRKRSKVVSYVYDDGDIESELASDYEPNSERPAKRKKTKKGVARNDPDHKDTHSSKLGKSAAHPVSLHVIKHPIDIRRSLLAWYSGVHENRGMPWRKPYDPSLNARGRSQRAYEVRVIFIRISNL